MNVALFDEHEISGSFAELERGAVAQSESVFFNARATRDGGDDGLEQLIADAVEQAQTGEVDEAREPDGEPELEESDEPALEAAERDEVVTPPRAKLHPSARLSWRLVSRQHTVEQPRVFRIYSDQLVERRPAGAAARVLGGVRASVRRNARNAAGAAVWLLAVVLWVAVAVVWSGPISQASDHRPAAGWLAPQVQPRARARGAHRRSQRQLQQLGTYPRAIDGNEESAASQWPATDNAAR